MLRVLNNTDDQVFVVQTGPGKQALALPPLGITGGSPSIDIQLPADGSVQAITCWLPLNGPTTATINLSSAPTRMTLPSTTNKNEEFIVDLRTSSDDTDTALLLGLFAVAPPPPSDDDDTTATTLTETGIAVGATVGTFLVGWALIALWIWATQRTKHKAALKDLESITKNA